MPIRLLAHGGTTFAERARIGRWPEIHPDVLQDNYGVGPNLRAYGLGLLGGDPFLILRERQQSGERFYPYTLLLDPGEPIWERFQWNAAALVDSIFRADQSVNESVGRRIWRDPARVREGQLAEWLDSLTPAPAGQAVAEVIERVQSLWVGSYYGKNSMTMTPSQLGLTVRPGPDQLAAILGDMPPALRSGRGWLVGGAAPHAAAYGAQLVLDDLRNDGEFNSEPVKRGKEIWDAWKRIEASDQEGFLGTLDPRAAQAGSVSALDFDAKALIMVAEALDDKTWSGPLFEMLGDKSATPIFSEMIWKTACSKMPLDEQEQRPFSDWQTEVIVHYACKKEIEIPGAVQGCLEDKAREKALQIYGYPEKELAFLKLSAKVKLDQWLADVANPKNSPAEIVAKSLAAPNKWTQEQQSKLIEEGFKNSMLSRLFDWKVLEGHKEVLKWLREQADQRVQAQKPDSWAEDYLHFGDADTWKTVMWESGALETLAKLSLEHLSWKNSRALLNALPGPNAKYLSLQVKREIAVSMKDVESKNPWAAFFTLDELFRGQQRDSVATKPETMNWLQDELMSMLDGFVGSSKLKAPNVSGLVEWDGLLTQPLVGKILERETQFLKIEPRPTTLSAALLGLREKSNKIVNHFSYLRQMLFHHGEGGHTAQEVFDHLNRLLDQLNRKPNFRNDVLEAIKSGLVNETSLEGFRERNRHPQLHELIFKIIAEDGEASARAAGALMGGDIQEWHSCLEQIIAKSVLSCFDRSAILYFFSGSADSKALRGAYYTAYDTQEQDNRGDSEIYKIYEKLRAQQALQAR